MEHVSSRTIYNWNQHIKEFNDKKIHKWDSHAFLMHGKLFNLKIQIVKMQYFTKYKHLKKEK